MRDASADGVAQAEDYNNVNHALVSDLVSLIKHVHNSLQLIKQTIARETSIGSLESSTNVIVLDDVSPHYMKVAAALQGCDVNLGIAVRSLLDTNNSDCSAASGPALSVIGAQRRPSAANAHPDLFAPRLLQSLPGVRHATDAPPQAHAASTMEKLHVSLNNMSQGHLRVRAGRSPKSSALRRSCLIRQHGRLSASPLRPLTRHPIFSCRACL
jgi:hypothetical protein